jgi:hypothetical protein
LGNTDSDPSGDKANHNPAGLPATIYPIYEPPPESDSEVSREVYMVGKGEEILEKTTKEIAREAEEITCAARLAKEADKGKRHNGLQDNSGSFIDEPRDDTLSRRHHLKFNSQCLADQD